MSADPRRLTRDEARRIAIRAQLLDADRPPDLGAVVDRLMFLQLDPTAVVAPSADLVAWTRLGDAYQPAHLQQALEVDHSMFEHRAQPVDTEPVIAMVHAMADLGLYLADMIDAPVARRDGCTTGWSPTTRSGSGSSTGSPTRGRWRRRTSRTRRSMPWASSGWTNDRNVTQMLEFLASRGYIAVAGRRGRQRLWDLAERVYPADTPVVPADEARRIRAETAAAIARHRPPEGRRGRSACRPRSRDTSGPWRVDPEATAEGFAGRTALLSPFDRLTHDRVRAGELFDFDYLLEMYKPAAQRRWGYFALPILHGDRLIGKVDSGTDRKASVLDVRAVHEDIPFTAAMTESVHAELEALAQWLGLTAVRYA